jgi:hypothetical protein
MTVPVTTREFVAKNFAHDSENRIHANDVAVQYGFRGGLVPGVTSFAYVIEAIVGEFGMVWSDAGRLNMRLLQPIYEDETVRASSDAGGIVSLVGGNGSECVEGRASTSPVVFVGDSLAVREIPLSEERPVADATSLAKGVTLGTLHHTASKEDMRTYLQSVNIDAAPWEAANVWHPGSLLLDANAVLSRNVVMGPWIHVGSDMSLFASIALGSVIETRSVVRDRYDRKGHEIVELDVTVHANNALVAHIHHTAIYKPRINRV